MSQSRHWSVSQSANKASDVCSCCQAVRQLNIKDGTGHSHGPRNNPCPGSHKLPLGVASAPSNLVNQSTSVVGVDQNWLKNELISVNIIILLIPFYGNDFHYYNHDFIIIKMTYDSSKIAELVCLNENERKNLMCLTT